MTETAPRAAKRNEGLEARARQTLDRAVDHLLGLQHGEGWWKGELETNVTMEAEDLLMRWVLGILEEDLAERTAVWIRSHQREDGTWANYYGGPPDLSTTTEAYVALRLAGDDPSEEHMAKAATWIRDQGGIEATRVFTRLWLALVGQWSWDDLPTLPPELILLPKWMPFNIYDFACWARQTVVALTVVAHHRPSFPLPFGLDELHSSQPARVSPMTPVQRAFVGLDRVLARHERLRHKPLRRLSLALAERWILARQEADGSWGGIQPPWVYSILALHLQGYPLDHPVLAKALAGLDDFCIEDSQGRRLEACQSPVWDTALAAIALADAGLDASHPALVKARRWLVSKEIHCRGDWAVRRPELAPGGWSFEFANVNYPDVDDTAEVVLALRRIGEGDVEASKAADRGAAWAGGMEDGNGGWAAFDVGCGREAVRALPFCDFGEVIDPPSVDVTAHVVEMLAWEGPEWKEALERGTGWLLAEQEPDGSWFGRWGANYVYGIGAALPALVAAGLSTAHPAIRRAVRWLERHQNADGGFGEDLRSYTDPATWRGRGASTASQTAWALLALLAAGERDNPATERAVDWLATTQRRDGSWDEPYYTGTGFPGDFLINYHLYRLVFPLCALGRYVHDEPLGRIARVRG
jgi:squalene-hopene/tetraprenyl-beta-curcumene cyclase